MSRTDEEAFSFSREELDASNTLYSGVTVTAGVLGGKLRNEEWDFMRGNCKIMVSL